MEKSQTHPRKRREGRANGKTGLLVCADKRRKIMGRKSHAGVMINSSSHSSFHSFAPHALFIDLIMLSVLLSSVFLFSNAPQCGINTYSSFFYFYRER